MRNSELIIFTKHYRYINLTVGQPSFPNNPTFILDLRVEALDLVQVAKK